MTSPTSQGLDILGTRLLERSFYHFAIKAWDVVESVPYSDNWHIRMIADHLQAVHEGQIPRLLVNIPPGCMKSRLTSVFWPAWRWIQNPGLRFVCASYSRDFATQHSVECRELVQSAWFRSRWGHRVRLARDQNQKLLFATTAGGRRLATTPGGRITGEHPDAIIVDDPLNATEAEKENTRKEVNEWWDIAVSSRGVSRNAARIIIMQRLHQDDLSGHVLEKDQKWVHICLPMEWEPDRMGELPVPDPRTGRPWRDPRTEEGELLWKSLLPRPKIDVLKSEMNSSATIAGQLQQRPVPRGGGMFKQHWLKILSEDQLPDNAEYDEVCRYWDKASGDDQGDYTAGVLVGRSGIRYYFLDVFRQQLSCGKRDDVIDLTAQLDEQQFGARLMTRFEQEPGSGGKQSAEISLQRLSAHRASAEPAIGTKPERAEPLASECERGNVFIKKAPWNRDFVNELCVFPYGKNDDQVDGASGAYRYLALHIRGPLSAAYLTAACRLEAPPNPKDHPFVTGAAAVYHDHRTEAMAYSIIGINAADRRFGLIANRTGTGENIERFVGELKDACRDFRIPGVTYIRSQARFLASALQGRGLRVYPCELDPPTRKKIGQTLADTFRDGSIDLYRDDELLRQLVRLPISKKTSGYLLDDPDEAGLEIERAMSMAIGLYWAKGMAAHLPQATPT